MSALPYWLSLGLLALMLLLREWQNARIQRELLNRLLVKHGVDPIPDEHPLAEAIRELVPERQNWPPVDAEAAKKKKRNMIAVNFKVPGTDILQTMLAKRAGVKE